MTLINIIHNFLLIFGMTFLGDFFYKNFSDKYFNDNKIEKLIFNFIIGFVIISAALYTICIYNFYISQLVIIINVLLIIFSLIFIFQNKLKLLSISRNKVLFIIIAILFTSTLLPISDADTIAYHLEIPKKIIENNKLIFSHIDYHEIFYGPGEAIYLLGIIFDNYNLPQFLNFVSFGILYLLFSKNLIKNNYKSKYLIFLFLSLPVLFQLFFSGKPQLIFIAINIFIFSLIFNLSNKKELLTNKNIILLFIYILLASFVSVLSKITFVLTVSIIILYFFQKNRKIFYLKNFYLIICAYIFLIFLIFIQKYSVYEEFSLFFLPSNLINFDDNFSAFLNNIKKSNTYHFFPINLLFPISKNSLLDNLGYFSIYLIVIFFLLKNYKTEKTLIILLILIIFFAGLQHPRFFIEPLLMISYILVSDKNFQKHYNKNYIKIILIGLPQIVYISFFIIYLAYLNHNLFIKDGKNNYLNNNAFGYKVSHFLNSKLEKKSKIIIDFRSLLYSKHEMFYLESLKFGNLNSKYKGSIVNINPDYIVIVGNKTQLDKCLGLKKFHNQLDVNVSRNPFKKSEKKIDVSIYNFSEIKLSKCF